MLHGYYLAQLVHRYVLPGSGMEGGDGAVKWQADSGIDARGR
jgi:hypothetical protein